MRRESISQRWYSRLASGDAQPNQAKLSGTPSSHWRTREEAAFGFLLVTVEPIGMNTSQTFADGVELAEHSVLPTRIRCAILVCMDNSQRHTGQTVSLEVDDGDGSERSLHWLRRGRAPKNKKVSRQPSLDPLILTTHGVSLRVENGVLTIQNGFTHYPQRREIIRYFRGDIGLPQRIILLDGSGSISFGVLSWLAEQKSLLFRLIG
jgi:hypothetical protein